MSNFNRHFEVVRLEYNEVSSFFSSLAPLDKLEIEARTGEPSHVMVSKLLSGVLMGRPVFGLRSKTTLRVYCLGSVEMCKEDTDQGEIWMLSRADIDKRLSARLKAEAIWTLKRTLANFMQAYPYVHNVVWAGNLPHIHLLKTLGFTIVWEDAFENKHGETFIPFFKEV